MNLTDKILLLKQSKAHATKELSLAREWVIKNGETSKQIYYIDNAHATVLKPYREIYDEYSVIEDTLETALKLNLSIEDIDSTLERVNFPGILRFKAPEIKKQTDASKTLKGRFSGGSDTKE